LIVQLHALPGAQSSDWHCDNPTDKALFWAHKDFQDDAVIIWEHLAEHYKNDPSMAGYNVLNEPLEETGLILNAVMARPEKARVRGLQSSNGQSAQKSSSMSISAEDARSSGTLALRKGQSRGCSCVPNSHPG
jgi:hypothetical protein